MACLDTSVVNINSGKKLWSYRMFDTSIIFTIRDTAVRDRKDNTLNFHKFSQ